MLLLNHIGYLGRAGRGRLLVCFGETGAFKSFQHLARMHLKPPQVCLCNWILPLDVIGEWRIFLRVF